MAIREQRRRKKFYDNKLWFFKLFTVQQQILIKCTSILSPTVRLQDIHNVVYLFRSHRAQMYSVRSYMLIAACCSVRAVLRPVFFWSRSVRLGVRARMPVGAPFPFVRDWPVRACCAPFRVSWASTRCTRWWSGARGWLGASCTRLSGWARRMYVSDLSFVFLLPRVTRGPTCLADPHWAP